MKAAAAWLAALTLTAAVPARGEEYYVVNHGWHSGIIIPRAAIPPGAWPPGVARDDFAGCRYLELGWGDRKFYLAKRPTACMAVSAALVPGPSVLHVAGFVGPPFAAGANQWDAHVTVRCTPEELAGLCRELGACFVRDTAGRAQPLGRGLYGFKSQFYAARGRYWIGNTCNTWTLRELRAGGLPTRLGPAGTLESGAVIAQTRRLAATR